MTSLPNLVLVFRECPRQILLMDYSLEVRRAFYTSIPRSIPSILIPFAIIFSGHPRTDRLTGLQTSANYVGCIKNIVIENVPLQVEPEMLRGDIMSHVCPTI